MKTDLYTKTVLTVIAIALSVIAAQQSLGVRSAVALGDRCGTLNDPCYVASDPKKGIIAEATQVWIE